MIVWNGDVVPAAPLAFSDSVRVHTWPLQLVVTCAVRSVPTAGESTYPSAWSSEPTLPPAISIDSAGLSPLHHSDALYTKRHFFTT